MDNLGTFEFVGDDEEQLHAWIKDTDGRRYGRPLITVLNHHSCVDEPFVVGRMTPISTLFWPSGSFFGPNAGVEIGMPPGMLFDGLTRTQLRSVVRSASDFASNERAQAAVAAAAAADEALDSAAAASTSMPAPAPDASTAAYASRKVLSIPAFGAAMRELQLSRGPKEMEPVTKWRAGRGNMRFTVCTREICFGTPVLSTVFSIGRGNAVMREAGIDQASLAWFQAHADAGHWTQIFPEARTWQEGGTPLRDDEGRWTSNGGRLGKPYSGVGPFKRGVGKVVANARITPVVVPLFHQGMATVLPQEPNNDVDSFVPVTGHDVTLGVGSAVDCTDLVVAYHRAALSRATAREQLRRRAEEAGTAGPRVPMEGHRLAMKRAVEEFGNVPAVFCGLPVPPGEDEQGFAGRIASTAGEAAKKAAEEAFSEAFSDVAPGSSDDAVAEACAAVRAAIGSKPAEEWDSSWSGHLWVPTRRARNKADGSSVEHTVPSYLEGPVRAKPPDFLWLSPDEAIAEHKIVLELYNDITARVEDGVREAEVKVLAKRHARGVGPFLSDRH